MTRADLDTALANIAMARELIREKFPAGTEKNGLLACIGSALTILEKHQPEGAP